MEERNENLSYKPMVRYTNLPDESVPDDADNANIPLDNIDYLKQYIDDFYKYFEDITFNNLIDYKNIQGGLSTNVTQIKNGVNVSGLWYAALSVDLPEGTYTCKYDFELIEGDSVFNTGMWRVQFADATYSNYVKNGNTMTFSKQIKQILFYVNEGHNSVSANFTKIIFVKEKE